MSEDDGEIPLLDADRLADHHGRASEEDISFVHETTAEDADERAITLIVEKLKVKSSLSRSGNDEIEDLAIELYNRSCRLALSGDKKHLEQLAALVEEDAEELLERLQVAQREEEDAEESGAAALLRALSDS